MLLPRAPIDRTLIAPSLVTADERQWLNAYQAEGYEAGYRRSTSRPASGSIRRRRRSTPERTQPYGLPKVAMRSMRQMNITRFSSIPGSRRP